MRMLSLTSVGTPSYLPTEAARAAGRRRRSFISSSSWQGFSCAVYWLDDAKNVQGAGMQLLRWEQGRGERGRRVYY
jgi:hypothetical protein